jgi:hypothetical protein
MFMKDAAARSIQLGKLATANWRERVGKAYSDDRNFEAAKKLRELSAKFSLTDTDWILLEGHFNCSDKNWLRAVRDTNRGIGFALNPADSTEYVAALLSNLTNGGVQ